jgi:hypothetical protein
MIINDLAKNALVGKTVRWYCSAGVRLPIPERSGVGKVLDVQFDKVGDRAGFWILLVHTSKGLEQVMAHWVIEIVEI